MNEIVQSEKVKADIEAALGLDKPKSRLWRMRPGLVVTAIAGAAVLLYLLFETGGSNNGVRYVTEPATEGDLTVTVTATGAIQPTNEVELSSELSGIVRSVLVDYNSAVTTGQTLASNHHAPLLYTKNPTKSNMQSD